VSSCTHCLVVASSNGDSLYCVNAPVLTGWWLTANNSSVGQLGKLLLVFASTVIPGFWSCGFYLMTLGITQLLTVLVGWLVAGPHQHSHLFQIPWGPMTIIFLSKTFVCFEMGPPLQWEEGSDCYWSLHLCWGWLDGAFTHNSVSVVNCCWHSPAQSCLVLGPTRLMALFYCLMTLLWILSESRVRVVLQLVVHHQSVHLGDKPLETNDRRFIFFNWTLSVIVLM
jgi:hypothetical protein